MPEITDEYPRYIENPIGMKIVGYSSEGRPIIENMDGSFSSAGFIIIEVDPEEWMPIPTMFRGKWVTPDHAVEIIKRFGFTDPDTGEALPRFPTKEGAEQSAKEREERITAEARSIKEGSVAIEEDPVAPSG